MSKLPGEWSSAIVAALAEPFEPQDHKTKRQGGQNITFVDVHRYKERLNLVVGPHGWESAVRFDVVGGKLIATVRLTVLGVTKENVGDEVEVPELNERGNEKIVGSPATNSYAQAFKRACSDFGLGDYLYDEKKREAAKRGLAAPRDNIPPQLTASAKEPATSGQDKLIRQLLLSHVFTDAERNPIIAKLDARALSKLKAIDAIDWLQKEVKARKAVEQDDAAEEELALGDDRPKKRKQSAQEAGR
jgi:hypothetical protein